MATDLIRPIPGDGAALAARRSTVLPDRLPPQNIEAEQGVIGAMMIDPSVIDDILAVLDPGEFYRGSHEIIARAIFEAHSEGVPVDSITIEDRLRKDGLLEKAGGITYLVDCINRIPFAADALYHAGLVKETAIARRLAEAYSEGLREVYANNRTAENLIEAAEARVFAVGESGRSCREAVFAHEEGARTLARIDRMRATGLVPGFRTGFNALDELISVEPNQLIILGARPSMGKTALGLQWAMNEAEIQGLAPLFVSLEMGREELLNRLLCVRSRVFSSKLRRPDKIGDRDMEALGLAQADLAALPRFVIDDTPTMNVMQIAASARRHRARNGVGIVFIDYIQLVDSGDSRDNRQEQIAKISRRLKVLAREMSVPVVAFSQLNRKAEDREDRRPRLADLRESGAIEQDADIVLLLHRPDYYDVNDSPGMAEVIVAKNRNGPTGTARLVFDRGCTRFDDFRPEPEDGDEDRPF